MKLFDIIECIVLTVLLVLLVINTISWVGACNGNDLNVPYEESGNYEKPPEVVNFSIQPVKDYAIKNKTRCDMSGMMSCTLMACGSVYINEDGELIPPTKCNTCTQMIVCDDGKVFTRRFKSY